MSHFGRYLMGIVLLWALGGAAQADGGAFRVLALGDSYTIGEGVPGSQRWPMQLAEGLRGEGLTPADPVIVARTGWTTDELQRAVAGADLDPPYDLVFLLIGVNDQYRGRSVEDYRPRFRSLLDEAISLAGNRPGGVIVLSIPDYSVTPFAQRGNPERIAEELARYNAVNKSESDSLGVFYVDITPISKAAGTDASLLAPDGLHPSGKMYRLWVEKVLPVVPAVLK